MQKCKVKYKKTRAVEIKSGDLLGLEVGHEEVEEEKLFSPIRPSVPFNFFNIVADRG